MTLAIIRGLPGSGKTTFAKKMFPTWEHISADDFFEKLGYWQPSLLKNAHAEAQRRVREALASGLDVAVHNTHTQLWELQPYLLLAREFGVEVRVIHVSTKLSDESLSQRNVHNVPAATIRKMRERWQDFFGEEIYVNK